MERTSKFSIQETDALHTGRGPYHIPKHRHELPSEECVLIWFDKDRHPPE